MAHFRISNSLEHLRAEERGGADAYASNPDLLVLRKLIEEEMEHVSPDGGLQAPWSPPALGVGSGFFTARPPPGQLSVGRWAAPGHWAAEARSHAFHAHEQRMPSAEAAPPQPLPDAAAAAAADERRAHAARRAAEAEALKRQQYSPPLDFHDYSKGGREEAEPPVELLTDVDYETARQVEVSEQAIASSWLSRLFGLGGFQTDDRKRRVSKPAPKEPAKAAPPFHKREHWIPEEEATCKEATAPAGDAHAAVQPQQAPQPSTTITDMLSAVVPDILQPFTSEQGIVSSLGLVLSTNKDKEVVFLRALPNSPADALLEADEGKILEGDVLFAVDGDPVYTLPLPEVVDKLGGAADTVATLHFLRSQPESAGKEESIKDEKRNRVFVTLIRADPADKINRKHDTPDNEVPAPSRDRAAGMFDFGIEVENESQASQRLGRQPLLSELRLEKSKGVPVQMTDEQPSLGADGMSGRRGSKTHRLDTSRAVSQDIEDEMKALKDRLSAKSALSLGHSMLRSVNTDMDPMAISKVMEVRNEEQVALQLRKAAEESREQYRELSKARAALKEEAVDKVRDFAKDWGDRERRIAQYLGLVRREEKKGTSLEEAIDGALTQRKDSTRALVLATYKAHAGDEARRETEGDAKYSPRTSSRSGKTSEDFEAFLSNLREDTKARAEKGQRAVAGDIRAEELGDLPTYVPVSTPAKSAGFAALQAQKSGKSVHDSSFMSARGEDDDLSSDDEADKKQRTELTSRSQKRLDLSKHTVSSTVSTPGTASKDGPWTVHVMVYEVENLPKSDVFGSANPYVCLSVLREDAEGSISRKYSISHNRDRNRKDPHYSENGEVYKANVEHKTSTKSNRVNASYEEDFRFYSSQPSPAHGEAILNGSPVWLLVTVWNEATRGADKLMGKVIVELSANGGDTTPRAEVKQNQWRTLVDENGRAVLGSDGSAARILLSAKYAKGDVDSSFTTLC